MFFMPLAYNILTFWFTALVMSLILPGAREELLVARYCVIVCFSVFFLWVINRLFIILKNAWKGGGVTEELLLFFYKLIFPGLYALLILYLPDHLDIFNSESVLIKGGFTPTTFNEVLLLAVLLFLALVSYKRCLSDQKRGTNSFIYATVKTAGWVFAAYACFLILPIITYESVNTAIGAFWSPLAYAESFDTACIFNVTNDSFYLVLIKLLFVLIANYQLHLVAKYYSKFFISHNYFVVIMILLWGNLFALGIDHIGITIMVFDIVSMCTAALIILHEKPNENIMTLRSLFYFLTSIFTSLVAYAGIYFLYSEYKSMNFSYFYLYLENTNIVQPNGYTLLAWFFIFVKVVFLIGGFPFYKVAIEVGSSFFFPAIFYWSVVSKVPAAFFAIKFFCIASTIDLMFYKTALSAVLVASIAYASFIFYSIPRLKVFFAYSSMVNIPYVLLFTAANWKASVFIVPINLFIYAVSMFGLMLFMSSSYKLEAYSNVRTSNDVDVFESFLWTSQEIRFSKTLNQFSYSKDVLSALIKIPTAVCALVLMGAAPFVGFLIKFLLISIFASSSSFFICFVIIVSTILTHLAYFNLFSSISEKICKYSGRSNNEWILLFEETDMGYFVFIFFFNLFAIFFLMLLMFLC